MGVPILCALETKGEMVDGCHAVNATWDEARQLKREDVVQSNIKLRLLM